MSNKLPNAERAFVDIVGSVTIRSAWIVRDDEDFPRLTTCYVVRAEDGDD